MWKENWKKGSCKVWIWGLSFEDLEFLFEKFKIHNWQLMKNRGEEWMKRNYRRGKGIF